MKILVDEMFDGLDLILQARGFDAQSVRKLQLNNEKIHSDYSILKRAENGKMVLITEDTDNIKGCKENGIGCVIFRQNGDIEMLVAELEELHRQNSECGHCSFLGSEYIYIG